MGLSGGFLEPLESTAIHLIQEGITTLLELFPHDHIQTTDIQEYNQRMGLQFDRVRDFLLLHYVATQRDDSEMWQYFRNLKLPESLQDKIDAWTKRGYIYKYDIGVFHPPSWVAVYIGQNLKPNAYDIRVDNLTPDTLKQEVEDLQKRIKKSVAEAPSHAAFIQQYGAAISGAVKLGNG